MVRNTDTSGVAPGGVFESAKHLLASIVAHLYTRLALLSTEFAEEKLRLTTLLYSALTALFLLFTALALALLLVIAAYWDTPYRLHAIGALSVLCLIGAGLAWRRVHTQLQSGPRLFEVSLAELYQDRQQLDAP